MNAALSPAQPSMLDVLRKPIFRKLWLAQLVSTVGSALTSLAAGILVFRLTDSALQVGIMLIATALPSLIIGLISGVFVDRFDRKRIMVAADVLRGILVLFIPILAPHSVVWLYLIVLLSSAIGTFFDPSFDSLLPEAITDEELAAANSLIAISSYGSTAVGYALSGFIASRISIDAAFYIDGLTFFLSAVTIMTIRIAPLKVEGTTNVTVVVRHLREGFTVLWTTPVLRSLLILSVLVAACVGLWNALLLPFAERALHATEFEYSLQEGLTSIGFVIGSLWMVRYASRLRDGQWIALSFISWGIVGCFYAWATSVPYALVLVMIAGFLDAPGSISRRTVIQRHTPREVRGRVFSGFGTATTTMMVLGLAVGGLADVIDVRILVFIGALMSVACGIVALVLPGLGTSAEEWKRDLRLLRGAAQASRLEAGRPITLVDMQRYAYRLPVFSALPSDKLTQLIADMRYIEAPVGTAVMRRGEASDAAYFLLEGQVVAGLEENGEEHVLGILNPGDFFGEMAALRGVPRTANIIVDEAAVLLRVPSAVMKELVTYPHIHRIFYTRMAERIIRMNMLDSPRLPGYDQEDLRELRTQEAAQVKLTQG